MHELSIVEALIKQVEQEVKQSGCTGRILKLDLLIGRLSGVNCDSVRFAFELLAEDTVVEGAELRIGQPEAACRCSDCSTRTQTDRWVVECPVCHSREITIEGGRELLLESIELED